MKRDECGLAVHWAGVQLQVCDAGLVSVVWLWTRHSQTAMERSTQHRRRHQRHAERVPSRSHHRRHWPVVHLQTLILSLWRDPDDVPHCRILSPDKTEWRLISATRCGWRRCFVADQLWLMTRIREEKVVHHAAKHVWRWRPFWWESYFRFALRLSATAVCVDMSRDRKHNQSTVSVKAAGVQSFGTVFIDLERPLTQTSRSHRCLTLNI